MDRQLGYAQKLEWLEYIEHSGACLVMSHAQDPKAVYIERSRIDYLSYLRPR